MISVHVILLITPAIIGAEISNDSIKQIEQLITRWAPLIWLAPNEKYLPLSVNDFLKNVHPGDENGNIVDISNQRNLPGDFTKGLYLYPNENIDELKEDKSSFLYGVNPNRVPTPIYAVVVYCTPYKTYRSSSRTRIRNDIDEIYRKIEPSPFFHVAYWAFYPYNQGKEICVLGNNVPTVSFMGRCLGKKKALLNHVGDWEHMSLSFEGQQEPKQMYLAVHDAGVYYKYESQKGRFRYESQITRKGIVQRPKFPPLVRLENGHPILFSAYGSHGLWSSPGELTYVSLPKLTDINGYGTPWKTWNNVEIYHLGISVLPDWMLYRGKWGPPKSNCFLFKTLGICEYNNGPQGILRKEQDFACSEKE